VSTNHRARYGIDVGTVQDVIEKGIGELGSKTLLDYIAEHQIEALIAEPYSDLAPRGISQWAQATKAKLGHPKVKFPEESEKASGNKTLLTSPWAAYLASRAAWKKEKFAQAFPTERAYRHSLKEEADAIRSALRAASAETDVDADLEQL
jgi:hypothetical protein